MEFTSTKIELKDNYALVKVLTDLDAKSAAKIREIFTYLIKNADRNVRLDLCMTSNLDSSGVGAIAFLYKGLKSLDFDLELTGLNEQAFNLIKLLHIDDIILCSPLK